MVQLNHCIPGLCPTFLYAVFLIFNEILLPASLVQFGKTLLINLTGREVHQKFGYMIGSDPPYMISCYQDSNRDDLYLDIGFLPDLKIEKMLPLFCQFVMKTESETVQLSCSEKWLQLFSINNPS